MNFLKVIIMRDEKIRKSIQMHAEFMEQEICILEGPAFDKSIIGITKEGQLIYDYYKMIEELVDEDNISYEDATEYIEYNTLRGIDYMENRPIICYLSREGLLETYF